MKSVSVEEMRRLDSLTISSGVASSEVLMDRAGRGAADAVEDLLEQYQLGDAGVLLVAGKGNNGGDAFVAARYLADRGLAVHVWLAGKADEVVGDAATQLSRLKDSGISLRELVSSADWEASTCLPAGVRIMVDGLLGTGTRGAPRGVMVDAIDFINRTSNHALVVALDIPSGLDGDTGQAHGAAVIADLTVTMGLPKTGLLLPPALEFVGNLRVVDIGIPAEFAEEVTGDGNRIEWIHPLEAAAMLPRRKRNSHKGTFGHVLLIGGAKGYAGAIVLAARGALRSGVGLVSVLTPKSVASAVRACVPEAMVHEGAESPHGSLVAEAVRPWMEAMGKLTALLVGPGLTSHPSSMDLLAEILRVDELPVVIDADALNVLEGKTSLLRNSPAKMVLTPHPGEMARLLGCSAADVQKDRFACARQCAKVSGEVVVLKGAGTVVVEEGRNLHVNLSGNPGMAKGGTGDVLGGLITGFLGQGMSCFEAARLGVYVHGRAGDLAASWAGQVSMTADDVVDQIPIAMREIKLR